MFIIKMRKPVILILSIFMTLFTLPVLFLFIKQYKYQEKLYYIEDIKLYVKVIFRPKDYHGYVILSTDSETLLSDSTDFIKTSRNNGISFIINSQNTDTIFIKKNLVPPSKIYQSHFKILYGTEENNLIFFQNKSGNKPSVIKYPYIGISIMPHFDHLYLKRSGDTYFKKVDPVK